MSLPFPPLTLLQLPFTFSFEPFSLPLTLSSPLSSTSCREAPSEPPSEYRKGHNFSSVRGESSATSNFRPSAFWEWSHSFVGYCFLYTKLMSIVACNLTTTIKIRRSQWSWCIFLHEALKLKLSNNSRRHCHWHYFRELRAKENSSKIVLVRPISLSSSFAFRTTLFIVTNARNLKNNVHIRAQTSSSTALTTAV